MPVPETSTDGGVLVIHLPRRLDADSSPEVGAGLQSIAEQSPGRILIDCSKTDYISSAGVRVLLVFVRAVQERGSTVALASLSRLVLQVFEMTGFDRIFTIYKTRKDALKQMQR